MNTPKTFIFIGRSGAGKGTQLELLKTYLSAKEPGTEIKEIVMGDIYRSFFKDSGYARDIARDITMNQGKWQPDFITNAFFIARGLDVVDGESTLIIDGVPRTIGQVEAAKDFLAYVHRENPIVINIEVSRESVKDRLLKRGRGDDTEQTIESRLNEYDRTVIPMIEMIKNDPMFTYVEVNGEPTVDVIHKDLIAALGI